MQRYARTSASSFETTYQQPSPNLCVGTAILVSLAPMSVDRIENAIKRIETAMERIDAARELTAAARTKAGASTARVVELVNAHEKLREQVAESLRELDGLLVTLEDESPAGDGQ